jgi:predicted ester cyclase
MASASLPIDRRPARIAIVEQHVRLENEHDLEGVLGTFGDTARLMKALPDLVIDIQRRHFTDDAIVLEVMIRGTHLGGWRGLPATGRRVEFPLCAVYTFDSADCLAGEKIYYDRGTVLRQLGVFHEPQSVLGQISVLATHPATFARIFLKKLLPSPSARRKSAH